MKRIYVAGLIADGGRLQPHEIKSNCDAFNRAEELLTWRGWTVFNPIRLHTPHPTELDEITFTVSQRRLRRDVQVLMDCDAIFMLPGWEHSQGARFEFHVATYLGLLAYLDRDDGWYPTP